MQKKKSWKKTQLPVRHYQPPLLYPETIDQRLVLRRGHLNLGAIMKTKHAVIVLLVAINLTSLLGSAYAAWLEPLAFSSKTTASIAGEPAIVSYPQLVDNSPKHLKMIKSHAKQLVTIWFTAGEWKAFQEIVYIESRWNYKAFNSDTNAYGLTQIIGAKRYAKNRPYLQLLKAVQYITHRYGVPSKALKHLKRYGWQ